MVSKKCKVCGIIFSPVNSMQKYCSKECRKTGRKKYREDNKERRREYNKEWYKNNKEKVKKYNEENAEKIKNRTKKYYQKPEVKEKRRLNFKKWEEENTEHRKQYLKEYEQRPEAKSKRLERIFGITLFDYNEILKKQNNCCYICYKHKNEFNKRLAVDHDHKTGEVRGLLCMRCNSSLGGFEDNVDFLKRAIEYLRRSKDNIIKSDKIFRKYNVI